ncbi:MAG: hypothetical protein ACXV9Q_01160 [Chthoniobacterales bacterium]
MTERVTLQFVDLGDTAAVPDPGTSAYLDSLGSRVGLSGKLPPYDSGFIPGFLADVDAVLAK